MTEVRKTGSESTEDPWPIHLEALQNASGK